MSKPTFENDWLDFKRIDKTTENKQKEIWGEALSGMANNEGGVILWGVDARKTTTPDGTEVDAARGLIPIENPLAFKSQLLAWRGDMTDPPVGGVEVESIEDPSSPGQGFVVSFIPESKFKPHRSNASGKQIYYVRLGDRFNVLPTSLLRSLFFPNAVAEFAANGILKADALRSSGRNGFQLHLKVALENCGQTTARDTYAVVFANGLVRSRTQIFIADDWVEIGNPEAFVSIQNLRPIHPGVTTYSFGLRAEVGETIAPDNLVIPHCHDISLSLFLFANNQPFQKCTLNFSQREAMETGGCSRRALAEEG